MPALVAVAGASHRVGVRDGAELLATTGFSLRLSREFNLELAADCCVEGCVARCGGVDFAMGGGFCDVVATGGAMRGVAAGEGPEERLKNPGTNRIAISTRTTNTAAPIAPSFVNEGCGFGSICFDGAGAVD